MENKINIAEILSDMPEGTKLYSPLFGKCEYIVVVDNKYPIAIKVQRADGATSKFLMKDGRYFGGYEDTECLLFPSDKMRDWSKFFKRGDVLVDSDLETAVVFDSWANDEQKALFIAAAEKYYGGKYNPETLQVDPVKVSKPKCSFEPFQKVLVRDFCNEKWKADYFSHYEDGCLFSYRCVGDSYKECVAYKGNEHLLGTNNNPE